MPIKDLLVNTLPQYCETLASGKQMCFRPILVSEEKALLLAKHSNNKQSILKTLVSIINTCFNTQKDVSIYDFENMFLLLRAKSLGEIENFKIKCPLIFKELRGACQRIFFRAHSIKHKSLTQRQLLELKLKR